MQNFINCTQCNARSLNQLNFSCSPQELCKLTKFVLRTVAYIIAVHTHTHVRMHTHTHTHTHAHTHTYTHAHTHTHTHTHIHSYLYTYLGLEILQLKIFAVSQFDMTISRIKFSQIGRIIWYVYSVKLSEIKFRGILFSRMDPDLKNCKNIMTTKISSPMVYRHDCLPSQFSFFDSQLAFPPAKGLPCFPPRFVWSKFLYCLLAVI